MEIQKILLYALQREIEGKRFFEDNVGRLNHAAVVSTFHMLAQEEARHIEIIKNQLQVYDRNNPVNIENDLQAVQTNFFSERANSEMIDQTILEAMVPDLPILRMAYLIERDFAEFYEMAAQKTEGQPRELLSGLAAWERGHERLFKHLHDQAFELYAQMPWGG